jgi:RimJ/RimL family protein N-acetyltransferase
MTDIATERLVLRLMDRVAMAAALAGDIAAVGQALGAVVPAELLAHPRGLEYGMIRLDEDPLYAPWGARAMLRGGQMVGFIRFHTRPDPPDLRQYAPDAVEFGYRVFAAHRRQGYAEEAARGVMDWAAHAHGVRNFIVTISPGNAASLALAARLGFAQVGEQMDDEDGLELVLLRPA